MYFIFIHIYNRMFKIPIIAALRFHHCYVPKIIEITLDSAYGSWDAPSLYFLLHRVQCNILA